MPPPRLIIHADDLGLAHSINRATLRAIAAGGVTSASIMVPAPAFAAAAREVAASPGIDIGLHFTLTCEVRRDRWAPVAPADLVPSLRSPDGSMWTSVDELLRHARPDEVAIELKAQVAVAQRAGITPTHLDSHMFALCRGAAMRAVFEDLARQLGVPAFNPFAPLSAPDRVPLVSVIDHDNLDTGIRAGTLERLGSGLHVALVHCGDDDEELRALLPPGPYDAGWRHRDTAIVCDPAFQHEIARHGVALTTWHG